MTGVGLLIISVLFGAIVYLTEDINKIREEIIEEERRKI